MGISSELRDHLLSQPPSFKKKKDYVLEELLGRGGFGKVVRATWTPPGGQSRQVALKYDLSLRCCVNASLIWDAVLFRIIPKKMVKDNISAVMDEINVLKGLDHPNIVHVWDHFESRDKSVY